MMWSVLGEGGFTLSVFTELIGISVMRSEFTCVEMCVGVEADFPGVTEAVEDFGAVLMMRLLVSTSSCSSGEMVVKEGGGAVPAPVPLGFDVERCREWVRCLLWCWCGFRCRMSADVSPGRFPVWNIVGGKVEFWRALNLAACCCASFLKSGLKTGWFLRRRMFW